MQKLYDKETLDRLHKDELEILHDFAEICEKHNLTYFGFGGTGIGALRHGGFIPWDDDIDLAMPRSDYEKAMKIIAKEMGDKYYIVNAENYDEFPCMNTHIVMKGTKFITEDAKKLNYPQGIFLDIFPVDNVPDDEAEFKKIANKAWFLSKLLIMKHIPFPVLPFRGFKAKICHAITWCAWAGINLLGFSHKFLYRKTLEATTRYNNQETKAYGYFCDTISDGSVFNKQDILPIKMLKFEDTEIAFPNNIHEILTRYYGDYMQLPPPEKRVNHCPLILEFREEN